MTERIHVDPPSAEEQIRLLAECVADLHFVLGTIVKNRLGLIPGEACDELLAAWEESNSSFDALVAAIVKAGSRDGSQDVPPPITDESLHTNRLLEFTGKAKRSLLVRLRDRFLMLWNSSPLTDKNRADAVDAAIDYLDFGATLVSSIPGAEVSEEFLLFAKQLLAVGAKRRAAVTSA